LEGEAIIHIFIGRDPSYAGENPIATKIELMDVMGLILNRFKHVLIQNGLGDTLFFFI
jgi:hypothetical protein